MKICKQCNAAQADEARFCNLCGAPMTGDEEVLEETAVEEAAAEEIAEETAEEISEEMTEGTSEETTEETAEEGAEAASEETPKTKKKTPWGWIIGLAAAVVLVVALILAKGAGGSGKPVSLNQALHTNAHGFESYTIHYKADEAGNNAYTYMDKDGNLISVKTESVDALMDQVVATVGIVELTNRDLAYYYDQQFFYFYSMYANLITQLMDTSLGLDEQAGVTGVDTWQAYFVDAGLDMFHQVAALYQAATEEGFMLNEEQQAELDKALDIQTQAEAYGFDDAEAFMREYFGPYATVESYQEYARMHTVVGFYTGHIVETTEATDEEVEAYFDANAAEFASNYGIEKIDKNVVNVRHILIQPAQAEDGSITDEAWAAAEEQANAIYEAWLAGAADETSFAEAATTNTQDPGSQATGGLYENVYPGKMVSEFNDWCFADGRQVGDHGVIKSTYGYHVMFFSGEGNYVYWRMAAEESLLSERATEACMAKVNAVELETNMDKIVILDNGAPTAPAAEEAEHTEGDGHNH